jgi:hypothetical protein
VLCRQSDDNSPIDRDAVGRFGRGDQSVLELASEHLGQDDRSKLQPGSSVCGSLRGDGGPVGFPKNV